MAKRIKRKYIVSLDPDKDFYDYWLDNCQEVATKTQLKMIYKVNFEWANWLLTHLLTRENRKNYALYSANAVLSIFETQYPLETRISDAILASTNDTINQSILDDAFAAYIVAATADFNANYSTSAYCAYIVSYGSLSRLINEEISNFRGISYLSAITAVSADVTKKQDIFDYGLTLI